MGAAQPKYLFLRERGVFENSKTFVVQFRTGDIALKEDELVFDSCECGTSQKDEQCAW